MGTKKHILQIKISEREEEDESTLKLVYFLCWSMSVESDLFNVIMTSSATQGVM